MTSVPAPEFEVRLEPPDIRAWLPGNTGIPGFTSLQSGHPGPHAAILAVTHGNEFSGAIVLDHLLRSGLTPERGCLTLGFVNIEAFSRFDANRPTVSRFVDEDLNRLWDEDVLDGPRRSHELDRAREIRPLLDTFDVLLDLHSMLWPSDPLILSGPAEKGAALAEAIATPGLVVSDHGHTNGKRIIDYPRFSNPGTPFTAILLEAGQHWREDTVAVARASVAGLLRHLRMGDPGPPPLEAAHRSRRAAVTAAITPRTRNFSFLRTWRGGDVVPHRNTLLAMDGQTEIRTPYDDCLLVMPSVRPSKGHTAVRLARFEPAADTPRP